MSEPRLQIPDSANRKRRFRRDRLIEVLTFWLRPGFIVRTIRRFQTVAGFDRAIALASSALTALIPLAIVVGAILPQTDGRNAAHQIVSRYGLTGGGAQAVRDALAPTGGDSADINLLGLFLLILAVLSFARGLQRMFERTWELKAVGVRNTPMELLWVVGLTAYIAFSWWIHAATGGGKIQIASNLVVMPASGLFLAWSGRILSARRLAWQTLLPFAVVSAVLLAICMSAAGLYLPHTFSSYASRYGVIGAVLAMISALFIFMVVVVASAAIGREVSEELARIQRGERPPEHEVRQEWEAAIDEARERWRSVREAVERLRGHFSR